MTESETQASSDPFAGLPLREEARCILQEALTCDHRRLDTGLHILSTQDSCILGAIPVAVVVLGDKLRESAKPGVQRERLRDF